MTNSNTPSEESQMQKENHRLKDALAATNRSVDAAKALTQALLPQSSSDFRDNALLKEADTGILVVVCNESYQYAIHPVQSVDSRHIKVDGLYYNRKSGAIARISSQKHLHPIRNNIRYLTTNSIGKVQSDER